GGRRRRIAGDLVGDQRTRLGIDQFDQPQGELGEMPGFFLGVRGLLHVEVSHHPQQRRPDIDAVAVGEFNQAVEVRIVRYGDHGFTDMASKTWHRGNAHVPDLSAPPVSGPLTMPVLNRHTDRSVAGRTPGAGVRGAGAWESLCSFRKGTAQWAAAAMWTPIPS